MFKPVWFSRALLNQVDGSPTTRRVRFVKSTTFPRRYTGVFMSEKAAVV
jgi:hypothetical protein